MPQALKKNLMKSHSRMLFLDDLPEFATRLVLSLGAGDCVNLTGVIGAGKTTFIYHVLRALGMAEATPFSSPTFTVLNQYRTRDFLVNHVDLYRLNSYSEFENLDITAQMMAPNAVTFIEWGDKFQELKSIFTKSVHFEYVASQNLERWVQFDGF